MDCLFAARRIALACACALSGAAPSAMAASVSGTIHGHVSTADSGLPITNGLVRLFWCPEVGDALCSVAIGGGNPDASGNYSIAFSMDDAGGGFQLESVNTNVQEGEQVWQYAAQRSAVLPLSGSADATADIQMSKLPIQGKITSFCGGLSTVPVGTVCDIGYQITNITGAAITLRIWTDGYLEGSNQVTQPYNQVGADGSSATATSIKVKPGKTVSVTQKFDFSGLAVDSFGSFTAYTSSVANLSTPNGILGSLGIRVGAAGTASIALVDTSAKVAEPASSSVPPAQGTISGTLKRADSGSALNGASVILRRCEGEQTQQCSAFVASASSDTSGLYVLNFDSTGTTTSTSTKLYQLNIVPPTYGGGTVYAIKRFTPFKMSGTGIVKTINAKVSPTSVQFGTAKLCDGSGTAVAGSTCKLTIPVTNSTDAPLDVDVWADVSQEANVAVVGVHHQAGVDSSGVPVRLSLAPGQTIKAALSVGIGAYTPGSDVYARVFASPQGLADSANGASFSWLIKVK